MSLYRGAGGASDATDDSTVNAVAGYASSAASSAAAAAGSASAANTSASAAATSASNASTSASSVASNATNASNSASLASTYAAAADISKNSAAASADIATTQAGLASSSASSASSSAATATSRAVAVTFSVAACANSATDAANSAASALAIYGNTAAMDAAVAAAAASASTATTQAGLASASASSADASESSSFENAQNAAEWASTAQGAANDAQASATYAAQVVLTVADASADAASAAASAATATTQAGLAAASAASASAVVLGNEPVRPAIKPTLLLDFANTEQLDPRITFTRASTATYYGTQTAKAEENLMLQSQDFTTTWTQSNLSRTANTTAAPDGSTTADTLTDTTDNGAHIVSQSPLPFANTVYTLSCFLKANTHNFAMATLTNTVTSQNGISAVVDLSTGAITQTATGTNATFTSSSITSIGNGWYRVVITGSSVAGFNRAEVAFAPAATGNTFATNQRISFTGTGTASFFAWGAQLEQRSAATAYTPTTTTPITNYIPQLLTAASGVARFDHNPITFESLGLEIEEQRTNLLTYSEQFDDAAWTKARTSITANAVVSPDGTVNADKLVEDTTASNTHQIQRSVSYTSGTTYTRSMYAKAAERTGFRFQFPSSAFTSGLNAYFDLATGTVGSVSTGVTATITPVGNGWYRCTATATATATASGTEISCGLTITTNNPTYTGDGYSGIYIWGAQLEAGAFATSYIPTVASQVTRAADAASMTGTNFSTWYNAGQGTLYTESRCPNGVASNLNRIASLNDGTASNRMEIDTGSTTTTVVRITTNGTSQGSPSAGTYTDFQIRKSALAIQFNNFTLAANTATSSDTSAVVPVVDRLMIGQSPSPNSNYLNGTMAKLAYYPIRCTDAQLQGMTTV